MSGDKPDPAYVDRVRRMMQAVKLSPTDAGHLTFADHTKALNMKSVSKATGIEYTMLSKFTNGKIGLSTYKLGLIEEYLQGVK